MNNEEKRCLYCASEENLKMDETDCWCCSKCEEKINNKVNEFFKETNE